MSGSRIGAPKLWVLQRDFSMICARSLHLQNPELTSMTFQGEKLLVIFRVKILVSFELVRSGSSKLQRGSSCFDFLLLCLRMLGELESAQWAFTWRKFAQLMSYSHECVNWLTSLFSDPKAPLINLVARDLPTLRHIVGSFFKADGLDDRVMPMPHDNLRSSSSFQVWWAKVNEFDPFICF